MTNQVKGRSKHARKFLLPLIFVSLLILGLIALKITGSFPFSRTTSLPATASENTKGELVTQSKNNQPQQTTARSTTETTAPLLTPVGTLVSNHRPNLSGHPASNIMASDCTTTSGAKCQIIFTMDTDVKSLPAEITDAGGSAYWNWTLQDIGLTVGSWQVKAVATLGSQTKTTVDAMALEVSQ